MKVIYARTIIEKIDEAITEAEIINRQKIEKIVLTDEEWREFRIALLSRPLGPSTPMELNQGRLRYQGIDVYREGYDG